MKTSRSVVFSEIIFGRHRSRFIFYMLQIMPLNKRRKRKKTEKTEITQNTFIVVLSVFKFVLGNLQKECLITHY